MTNQENVKWDTPIFIITAGRSGSVHLRNTLNAHPDVALTSESNLAHFFKLSYTLAALSPEELLEQGQYRLFGLIPDLYKPLFTELYLESILQLWQKFYLNHFNYKQFTRWGDKFHGPSVISDLINVFPQAQFIHLVRDGRDRTVSAMKFFPQLNKISSDHQAEAFEMQCHHWRNLNNQTLDKLQGHPDQLLVRYEDLVTSPQKEVSRILRFLRLSNAPSVFHYIEHSNPDFLASHATSPNVPASIGRWKHEMNDTQKEIAHQIMGDMLVKFGYTVD